MVHNMKLRAKPYSMIANGSKTIELRLYDEKRRKISVGDQIVFTCVDMDEGALTVVVKQLHIFPSFSELYEILPLDKCGYTEHELSAATADDMNVYYDRQAQGEYGVVGIEIERIK